MKLTEKQFVDRLIIEAQKIGLQLTPSKCLQLYKYKDLLIEWNDKINLTAIVDDEEIIMKHIIDSLYCVKYIKNGDNIIDVGTGAGLPGMIISIYFEGMVKVTLLDALNKRIIFLKEVLKKLDIKNVEVVHTRAEDYANDIKHRETYDIVISRAVARLNVLLELTTPFAKIGGKCLYMKAEKADEEMSQAMNAIKKMKVKLICQDNYSIVYNNEEFNRNILVYEKLSEIELKYPRQFSKIKKQPL